MATRTTSIPGLSLSNIPLLNARTNFNLLLALFRAEDFRQQFRAATPALSIRLPSMVWKDRPSALLTHVLREAIIGIECSVAGAVFTVALKRETLDEALLKAIRNPSSLGGSTAGAVFNGLPGRLDPGFTLRRQDGALWKEVQEFYSEVRNPLFHAYEVEGDDPEPIGQSLELIHRVYRWIDGWCPVELLLEGPIQWSKEYVRRVKEVPRLRPGEVQMIVAVAQLPKRDHLEYLPPEMDHLSLSDIRGLGIPSKAMVDVTAVTERGNHAKLELSPLAAMRLLGGLALVQQKRGWEIPNPLFE